MVQGPDGVVARKTVQSVELVLQGLHTLRTELNELNPTYAKQVDFKALLTLVCERLFSTMRFRYDLPLALHFAQHLGPAMIETLKRMTNCGFRVYTFRTS